MKPLSLRPSIANPDAMPRGFVQSVVEQVIGMKGVPPVDYERFEGRVTNSPWEDRPHFYRLGRENTGDRRMFNTFYQLVKRMGATSNTDAKVLHALEAYLKGARDSAGE